MTSTAANVSGERMFANGGGPGAPDGSTVDADGCLWNAEWGGGRVVRYTPDGRVDRVIALPCAQVTCCAFGGARLDQLFVTTARTGLDAAALAGQPQAGALFVIDAGVTGLADTPFPPARLPFSDLSDRVCAGERCGVERREVYAAECRLFGHNFILY